MKKPNVILISIDSLRADAVSALNPQSGYTPFLREFARGSTVFESAFAQADWTVPSHMSVFTGLYPTEHGVISGNRSLGSHPTLAERSSELGYETKANFRLSWFNGGELLRGFEQTEIDSDCGQDGLVTKVKNTIKKSAVLRRLARGVYRGSFRGHMHDQSVVESAINDVMTATQPFFHFLHLNDAHWPYSPTAPFHKVATNQPTWRLAWNRAYTQQNIFDEALPDEPLATNKMELMRDLYLGAVRQIDYHLKSFITNIPAEVLQNTVIIIFGDHGEAFGEKDEIGHNAPIPEVTHVPLIVRDPTERLPATRIAETVQISDLYPTVAEIIGVDIPQTNMTSLLNHEKDNIAFTHAGEEYSQDNLLSEYVAWRSPEDYLYWDKKEDTYIKHGNHDGLNQALENHINSMSHVTPQSTDQLSERNISQLKDLGYM
jgi:arylsulfatase A-like enzyme